MIRSGSAVPWAGVALLRVLRVAIALLGALAAAPASAEQRLNGKPAGEAPVQAVIDGDGAVWLSLSGAEAAPRSSRVGLREFCEDEGRWRESGDHHARVRKRAHKALRGSCRNSARGQYWLKDIRALTGADAPRGS